jgi:prevent-host-death family protein
MGPKFDMGHGGPRRFATVMLVLTSIKTRGRTFFHSITGQSANRASLGKHRLQHLPVAATSAALTVLCNRSECRTIAMATTILKFRREFEAFLRYARCGPIEITRHGRRAFVLMSPEQYDWVRAAGRRAYRTTNATTVVINSCDSPNARERHLIGRGKAGETKQSSFRLANSGPWDRQLFPKGPS